MLILTGEDCTVGGIEQRDNAVGGAEIDAQCFADADGSGMRGLRLHELFRSDLFRRGKGKPVAGPDR